MTKIKKAILIFFLGFASSQVYSQVYKFKTSGYSVLNKTEKGKWGQWSETKLINIAIDLDTTKNRIVLFDEMIQIYDITKYVPTEESENDIIYTFNCNDHEGNICILSIITRKKQNNRKQLYINYNSRIVVYNLFVS